MTGDLATPEADFVILAALGMLVGTVALALGLRWTMAPASLLLLLGYLPAAAAPGSPVVYPMAYLSLLFLLNAMADHGLLIRRTREAVRDAPEVLALLRRTDGRAMLAMATAVGASYFLAVVLLQAGFFLGFGFTSEWTAFALGAILLAVVGLLASLPRGQTAEEEPATPGVPAEQPP